MPLQSNEEEHNSYWLASQSCLGRRFNPVSTFVVRASAFLYTSRIHIVQVCNRPMFSNSGTSLPERVTQTNNRAICTSEIHALVTDQQSAIRLLRGLRLPRHLLCSLFVKHCLANTLAHQI